MLVELRVFKIRKSEVDTMARRDGAAPTHTPRVLTRALADVNEVATKRFDTDFEGLVRDEDRNRAAARMRHVVGVVVKKDYSDVREVRDARGRLVDVKWEINVKKLTAMPDSAWQLRLLAGAEAQPSAKYARAIALDLARETLLQRYYFKLVHPYLCQSVATRTEIKKILRQFGLGEFAGLATAEGLVGLGSLKLYAFLVVAAPSLPAGAIAVTALALCVTGLERVCRSAKDEEAGWATKAKKKLAKKKKPKKKAPTQKRGSQKKTN